MGMNSNETIHISWIHAGEVDALFMTSVLDLVRHYTKTIGSYNAVQGLGLLTRSRNVAVKFFLEETKDDWMLIVDSDEYIPQRSFKKLIDAADSWKTPIVSGLVFAVLEPFNEKIHPEPCIFIRKQEILSPYYDYKLDSLIEVDAAGTGCLLIHRRVLEKMREDYQDETGADWAWFQDGPAGENLWVGEDISFCKKVVDSGFKIHAHTGAILPHHKGIWISESTYGKWVEDYNTKRF